MIKVRPARIQRRAELVLDGRPISGANSRLCADTVRHWLYADKTAPIALISSMVDYLELCAKAA